MKTKKFTCLIIFLSLLMSFFTHVNAAPNINSKFSSKSIINTNTAASSLISSLDFTPTDAFIHPTKTVIYLTDTARKRIYSVDFSTKAISYLQLDLKPERLTYSNNELYATLLISGHTDNPDTTPNKGAVGIINTDTFKEVKRIYIDLDPYDVAVDKAGFIYVASGSSQLTCIRSYSRTTGKSLSEYPTYMGTLIELHPTMNKLYSVSTQITPTDIGWFSFDSTGTLTGGIDSPYHGDYSMLSKIKISPDGNYIFNYAGTIFSTSLEVAKDMKYIASLGGSFTDIDFDRGLGKFYTASGNKILAYDYNTFANIGYLDTTNQSKFLFSKGNYLVSVSCSSSGSYSVETFETSSMETVATSIDDGIKMYGNVIDTIYDSAKNKAYAIDAGLNNLFILNLDNHSIDKTVKLPYKPDGLCLSEDGTKIYIANNDINYLITEVSLTDYTIRNSYYATELNCRDFANKKIVNKSGKLFITTGDWNPRLLTFDASTLNRTTSYPELESVGGMALSSNGSYLYTWYQYGWDAGVVYSSLSKYSLANNTFVKVSEGSNSEFGRDPLKTPIILLEDYDIALCKGVVFSLEDLSINDVAFDQAIYAMSKSTNILASNRGIYRSISTGDSFLKFLPERDYDVKFFTDSNMLYILENNVLYNLIPLPGDANADEIVDIKDLALTAKSYNSKRGTFGFSFTKDFNYDAIIDLYDLVIVSRNL